LALASLRICFISVMYILDIAGIIGSFNYPCFNS